MKRLVLGLENLLPEILIQIQMALMVFRTNPAVLRWRSTQKLLALMCKSKKANPQTPHGTPGLGFEPCYEATSS